MRLEKLQYQLDAIDRVIGAIDGRNIEFDVQSCANPVLRFTRNIDVKMETGTGKTYVYTRLIYRLKQKFGFFKFIIIVPSVPIKEGVKMSITSDDWNKHFKQEFANLSIHFGVINAGDFDAKRGSRKQIPESLRSFCDSSRAEEKNINILLLNDGMLASSSMSRDDYDSTLLGCIGCPLDGLKATRPIVIIDEPHRFKKDSKAWQNIVEKISPQLIIRFGATFPNKILTKEKNRQNNTESAAPYNFYQTRTLSNLNPNSPDNCQLDTSKIKLTSQKKDYENLVYNLNAVQAFNEGLVKGVQIVYPAIPNNKENELVKFKVDKINPTGKKTITLKKNISNKTYELRIGDDLSTIPDFDGGIYLEAIKSTDSALLSNELELHHGTELIPQILNLGYQELILQQALDAHFEKEQENFYRKNQTANLPRIKTNSLFFIDSIESFRGGDKNDKGWLRVKFEELLVRKLREEIKNAKDEYREFLEATLQDVSKTIAGYFAEDNTKKRDEAIQNEVDDILRNKEQMLKFKNADGTWNVRRFLFSKWTLREGWDNPNIFVIAKLRSSGSEISKIQEVGRGLRLPFDENGTRVNTKINKEAFRLTYIIDYSERDFAKKLVGEINVDGMDIADGKINSGILSLLIKSEYADTESNAKEKLLRDCVIDVSGNILDMEKLFVLLPSDANAKINDGIIIDGRITKHPKTCKIKDNFHRLQELWDRVSRRYLLRFEKISDGVIGKILADIFSRGSIFASPSLSIIEETIARGQNGLRVVSGESRRVESQIGVVSYGEFLMRLSKRTALPVGLLHEGIVDARKNKTIPNEFFNTATIDNTVNEFEKMSTEIFGQKFSYNTLDFTARTSLFANEFCIGNLTTTKSEEMIIYDKLPEGCIKLPTYTGGTTSPDFIYSIHNKKTDTIELHLIINAKKHNTIPHNRTAKNRKKLLEQFEQELKKLAGETTK
ncbi:MAG: DEAD/DEAH box helicase family protein [Planctomycetaceae bacterium]|jgi:type III restriction enzyme|nr:DEAD/DEAH box helicase family protein [Planctomycetaceae bacterium]